MMVYLEITKLKLFGKTAVIFFQTIIVKKTAVFSIANLSLPVTLT